MATGILWKRKQRQGKDQQPFAGKAESKNKKGKANVTEDPSATSTTADNASWQGDDASGVGTEGLGLLMEKTGISPDGMIVSRRTV